MRCIAIQEEGNDYWEERQNDGKNKYLIPKAIPFIAVNCHSGSKENRPLWKLLIANV